MAWTQAADVLDSWIGDDKPDDTLLIDRWIDRAERLIRFRVPTLPARLEAGEIDLAETVIDVVTAMVMRKLQNPRGMRQLSSTTGPFTESATFGGTNPGELDLLDSELERLTGGTSTGGTAHSIDLIPSSSRFSGSADWWPFYVG